MFFVVFCKNAKNVTLFFYNCDVFGNCDTPFFMNLYSASSHSYNIVTFSGKPFFSSSLNLHEPCVSSRRVAAPKSQEEWFCETCDCFVQYNNSNYFSDFDFKHCRLFFAECQTVGVFKNAPVGQDSFFTTILVYNIYNINNACSTRSSFPRSKNTKLTQTLSNMDRFQMFIVEYFCNHLNM